MANISDKSLSEISDYLEKGRDLCVDKISVLESGEGDLDYMKWSGLHDILSNINWALVHIAEIDAGIYKHDFDRDIARIKKCRDDLKKAKEELKNK